MNLDGQGGTTGGQGEGAPNIELWSRQGYVGDIGVILRPNHTSDFTSAEGLHAPHRLDIANITAPDGADPAALPIPFMVARDGLTLLISNRQAPMPFVYRNVEADEIHFIQKGQLKYTTDFGVISAEPGDFVCIPRSVAYRTTPLEGPTLSLIIESPEAVKFDTLAPFGMINYALSVKRPVIEPAADPGAETVLIVKSFDGLTRYIKPHDPLAAVALIGGQSPVWKLNLRDVAPLTYEPGGGPPWHFAATTSKNVLLYTLSARTSARPPLHHNADYDEVIFYFDGPEAYGEVNEPGTFTWVPKGVGHHGPTEDVGLGRMWMWLLESASTLRFTPAGLAAAELMETNMYGRHPSSQKKAASPKPEPALTTGD
jgi:homogentisate 1,2-dioxygenase